MPLGQYRLMLTKLVILILRLKRDELNKLLISNDIFKTLSGLIAKHPWNNFFQLAIIKIYDEIIENCKSPEFRTEALKNSKLIETIVGMKEVYNFKFGSERTIRHGYMGMVIKISNMLVNQSKTSDVAAILEELGEEWTTYITEELEVINEINNKRLGGQEPKSMNGNNEEEDTNFEPMEQIMARFSNFSSNSSAQGQNDEEDDEDDCESGVQTADNSHIESQHSAAENYIVDVEIQMSEPVVEEFFDNQYWKKPLQYNIADLDLSEFE